MKTKITIADIDRWGACERNDGERYSDENLEKLLNGRKYITPREALSLEIPDADKIWLILREEILGKKNYYEIGHIIAREAVKNHCENCGIPDVEKWAREYMAMSISSTSRKVRAAWAERASEALRASLASLAACESRASLSARTALAALAEQAAWTTKASKASEAARAARAAESKRQVELLKKYF